MDWSPFYPKIFDKEKTVEFADIGCGYGGLLGKTAFWVENWVYLLSGE